MILLPESSALKEAVVALKEGNIVIHPTETCYGIAADLTNPRAVQTLFALKKRPLHQPLSALFSSVLAAAQIVEFSPKAAQIAARYLPGPLTLVLPKISSAPLWVTADGGGMDATIGVRVSSHPFAMELARLFGGPVATTSANLHGKANPYSPEEILAQFGQTSDIFVVDGGRLSSAPPSTVISVTGDSVKVLRQGDIKMSET